MPLFAIKISLIFFHQKITPADIHNLSNDEAIDHLFGRKEEKECPTAPLKK